MEERQDETMPRVTELKAPEYINVIEPKAAKIFLAGTIDMGNSHDWQANAVRYFKTVYITNIPIITIINPRRDNWDPTWKHNFSNPQFYQQVNWELDGMDKADIIIMNFLPESQSPITLLELGLYAGSGKLIVCCPDEFWRSGNVQIVCNNYNIPLFKDMQSLLNQIKQNNT